MELKGYLLGILVGLVVGVLLIVFLLNKKTISFKFDERQKQARQKGLSWFCGFLGAGAAAVIVLDIAEALQPGAASLILEVAAFLGGAVFAAIAIKNDAWMSMEENPKKVIPLCIIVLLLNVFCAMVPLFTNEFAPTNLLNFFCALLMLWILLLWAIHRSKKGADDEESES